MGLTRFDWENTAGHPAAFLCFGGMRVAKSARLPYNETIKKGGVKACA